MKKSITIRDVAKQAGVSMTTVSQILNNKGSRFSQETQNRVFKAKADLGYLPNYNAQHLVMETVKTIGVLVPDITNPFFNSLVRVIEDQAYQNELIPLIFDAHQDTDRADYYLEELVKRAVDGVIIASNAFTSTAIDRVLRQNSIPYLLLDRSHDLVSDQINVDDFDGGKQAAEFLVANGHHRLAMILPEASVRPDNINQRLEGFKSIHNVEVIEITADLSRHGGDLAATQLVKTDATGVFVANEEIAVGLYHGLTTLNKKIPTDYAVIGYDGTALGRYLVPELTTIKQPIEQIGELAISMMLKRIQNENAPVVRQKLPIELIKRGSV